MNQEPKWGCLLEKIGGEKSCDTVPYMCLYTLFLVHKYPSFFISLHILS
jgi:hypothetical protein